MRFPLKTSRLMKRNIRSCWQHKAMTHLNFLFRSKSPFKTFGSDSVCHGPALICDIQNAFVIYFEATTTYDDIT